MKGLAFLAVAVVALLALGKRGPSPVGGPARPGTDHKATVAGQLASVTVTNNPKLLQQLTWAQSARYRNRQ